MFADTETLQRRLSRARSGEFATVEIGHAATKNGVLIRLDGVSSAGLLEVLLRNAFSLAVEQEDRLVGDSGWWAAVVCAAALRAGRLAAVERVSNRRSSLHACVVVQSSPMLAEYPDWPVVRIRDGALMDLRPEEVLAEPSDGDLLRFADGVGVQSGPALLRDLFHEGILDWSPDVCRRTGFRKLFAVDA